ncbi:MAG TPA: plastocyanin/azurin family copper-binding protein [Sporichthya sp.]|nr:plastocyanin/azurin family copper-binding protein [Sporichthya sp.]
MTRQMRPTLPRRPRAAAIVTVGAAALLSVPWSAAAGTESLEMRNFAFSAPAVQVAVGDTVTWTNQDKALHDATTTKAPVAFASPYLKTGESWSYTFTAPGVYSYICSLHPKMVASITAVGAAPTPTPVRPKPVAKAVAAGRATPTPAPRVSPTPTPAVTPTAKAATAPKPVPAVKALKARKAPEAPKPAAGILAAAPAAPVTAAAPPRAVAPVLSSDELDLMPAVEIGGLAVTVTVLALLAYGFRAGRRAG